MTMTLPLPADSNLLNAKEPQPWDRAAVPTEVPIQAQVVAIEDFLREAVGPTPAPLAGAPIDLLADMSASKPTPSSEVRDHPVTNAASQPAIEEFKPTDQEWENVKRREFPEQSPSPLEPTQPPAYKPEILERDA
jgi:hypothetical protein